MATNPVTTYAQPVATQAPTTFKVNLAGATNTHHRIGGPFAPHESNPAAMTVSIDGGYVWDGTTLTEVAAQTTAAITAPTAGNERYDRVVVDAATGATGWA